jgi:hypothetical protein
MNTDDTSALAPPPAAASPSSRPGDDGAARLADAILDAILGQPLEALLPPMLLARLLREASLWHLRSAGAEELMRALLPQLQGFLRDLGNRPLRDALPQEAVAGLRELLTRPYTPDRALLVAALSSQPFRRLNRELMVGTLLDYSRRLRTSVEGGGMGKGLSTLGRLASEAVKKSTSALGSIAPGMTSAVSDEFERQMQRRAADFADGAVDEMVQRVATTLTDPTRTAEQTELKLALLDFMLELRGAQVARELERMQPAAVAASLSALARVWLDREQATMELAAALLWLMSRLRSQPPAAVRSALHALLAHVLRPLLDKGAPLSALAG